MRTYLKNLRKSRALSQVEMANLLNISQQYYSFIENGDRQKSISLSLLQKLSYILDVSFLELVEKEQKWNSDQNSAATDCCS